MLGIIECKGWRWVILVISLRMITKIKIKVYNAPYSNATEHQLVSIAVSKFVVLLPDGRSDGGPRRGVRGDDTRSAQDGNNLAAGTSFYSTAAAVSNYGLPRVALGLKKRSRRVKLSSENR